MAGRSSNYTTMFLEEHNVTRSTQNGFCVYDSRGFDCDRIDEGLEELSTWMDEGVQHNQLCLRPSDGVLVEDDINNLMSRSSAKFVRRRVDCAMVVVNIMEVYKAFKAGNSKPLEATRELYCSPAFRKCCEFASLS